jgi:cytochrome c oxidase cbb3-type subunit IV
MRWSRICRVLANTHREEVEMLSGIVTAILLALFVFGCVWAYQPKRQREFDSAAMLPLGDDSKPANSEEEIV